MNSNNNNNNMFTNKYNNNNNRTSFRLLLAIGMLFLTIIAFHAKIVEGDGVVFGSYSLVPRVSCSVSSDLTDSSPLCSNADTALSHSDVPLSSYKLDYGVSSVGRDMGETEVMQDGQSLLVLLLEWFLWLNFPFQLLVMLCLSLGMVYVGLRIGLWRPPVAVAVAVASDSACQRRRPMRRGGDRAVLAASNDWKVNKEELETSADELDPDGDVRKRDDHVPEPIAMYPAVFSTVASKAPRAGRGVLSSVVSRNLPSNLAALDAVSVTGKRLKKRSAYCRLPFKDASQPIRDHYVIVAPEQVAPEIGKLSFRRISSLPSGTRRRCIQLSKRWFSSNAVDESGPRGYQVSFDGTMLQYLVPKDEQNIAARSYPFHQFVRRNQIEMDYEGSKMDLEKVIEDQHFFICSSSGDRIHPAHTRKANGRYYYRRHNRQVALLPPPPTTTRKPPLETDTTNGTALCQVQARRDVACSERSNTPGIRQAVAVPMVDTDTPRKRLNTGTDANETRVVAIPSHLTDQLLGSVDERGWFYRVYLEIREECHAQRRLRRRAKRWAKARASTSTRLSGEKRSVTININPRPSKRLKTSVVTAAAVGAVGVTDEAALRSKCAVCLQSTIRGYMIRKQQRIRTLACVQIQRTVRGFLVRLEFHLRSIDIIVVQSVVRRWLVRRDVMRRVDAVLCLQRLARCLHSRTVLKEKRELCRRHRAATLIQKTWRCYSVHVDYRLLILSIIAIQSAVRRCQGCIRHAEARNAALRIQVAVRKWLSARLKDISARKIQAAVRAFLAPLADDDAKDEDDEQEEETTPAPQRPQAVRRSPRNHPRSATPASDEDPEVDDEEPAGFTAMDNDAEDEDEDEDEEQEEETAPAPHRRRVPLRAVRRSPRNHPRPATRRSRRIAAQERRYGRPNYKD